MSGVYLPPFSHSLHTDHAQAAQPTSYGIHFPHSPQWVPTVKYCTIQNDIFHANQRQKRSTNFISTAFSHISVLVNFIVVISAKRRKIFSRVVLSLSINVMNMFSIATTNPTNVKSRPQPTQPPSTYISGEPNLPRTIDPSNTFSEKPSETPPSSNLLQPLILEVLLDFAAHSPMHPL